MAETRLIGRQNLPDGGQSGLDVGQTTDIVGSGCKNRNLPSGLVSPVGPLRDFQQVCEVQRSPDSPKVVL
jgi:hypothetical protein